MRGHALAAEICERGERKKEALMESDPVRGKTIRWMYDDGPMAGKSFEHSFGSDGTVTWRATGGQKTPKQPTNGERKTGKAQVDSKAKYEVAPVNDEVYAVSYLSASGYTLTSVLDFARGTMVSVASNERELVVQRGTFEVAERVS